MTTEKLTTSPEAALNVPEQTKKNLGKAATTSNSLAQTEITLSGSEVSLSSEVSSSQEAPTERIGYYADEIRDLELSFARRLDKMDGTNMTEKEFEKWEDDFADYYKSMNREIERKGLTTYNLENLATIAKGKWRIVAYPTKNGYEKDLRRTIEAQAGNFYYERADALEKAIMESGKSEDEINTEINTLKAFYPAVMSHLDFKFMSPLEVNDYPAGAERYEKDRTEAHNNAIKALNSINNLAKKYHLRPFTPRDFWPSDMCPKKHQTAGISQLFRYDRDIVEEYYAVAFSSEVRERHAKQARDRRFGLI